MTTPRPTTPALLCLILLAPGRFAALAADPPPPYDASVARGGPMRAGDLGAIRLPATGDVIWRVEIEDGTGAPVLADGVIYLAGGQSSLFAVKADGSAILWQDDRPGRIAYAAPLVVGDRIYLASNLGLSAHARDGGAMLWDYSIPEGASSTSPLIVAGKLVTAGADGRMHAVDPATGAVVWKHDFAKDAPDPVEGEDDKQAGVLSPNRPMGLASDGVTLYLSLLSQGRVIAVDAATGERRWAFRAKGWTYAGPTIAGDDLFCTSKDGRMYCLDRKTGEPRWEFATGGPITAGVVVRDVFSYFGSGDGAFYKVEIKTGKKVWAFETAKDPEGKPYTISSSPIIDADSAFFGSLDGFAYSVKLETGELRWKVKTLEGSEVSGSPVTDGRQVFLSVRPDLEKGTGTYSLIGIGTPAAK